MHVFNLPQLICTPAPDPLSCRWTFRALPFFTLTNKAAVSTVHPPGVCVGVSLEGELLGGRLYAASAL